MRAVKIAVNLIANRRSAAKVASTEKAWEAEPDKFASLLVTIGLFDEKHAAFQAVAAFRFSLDNDLTQPKQTTCGRG